jgi:hypothetical protein
VRTIKAIKSQGDGDDRNNALAETAAAAANQVQRDIEAGRTDRPASSPGKGPNGSSF